MLTGIELPPCVLFTPRPGTVQALLLSLCVPRPFLALTPRVLEAVFLVRSFLQTGQFVNGVARFSYVCCKAGASRTQGESSCKTAAFNSQSKLHSKSEQQQQYSRYKTKVVQLEAQPLLLLQVPIATGDGMLKVVRVFPSHQ